MTICWSFSCFATSLGPEPDTSIHVLENNAHCVPGGRGGGRQHHCFSSGTVKKTLNRTYGGDGEGDVDSRVKGVNQELFEGMRGRHVVGDSRDGAQLRRVLDGLLQ